MTYEGMKPMTPTSTSPADWVRQGGALVFLGDDTDPFNAVRSWWNDPKAAKTYKAPRAHLFERLGLPAHATPGLHKVGNGFVVYDTASPASLSYRTDGAEHLLALVKRACVSVGLDYAETNHLTLRRGPYVVAAGSTSRSPVRTPSPRPVPRPLRRCPTDGRRRDSEARQPSLAPRPR